MVDNSPVSSTFTLSPGTVLQGRYEVLRVIAVGGLSTIYCVQDRRFSLSKRLCALKEMTDINPDPVARKESLTTFEHQISILASFSHPAMPQIFDFFSEDNKIYLVMELIAGKNLEDLLVQAGSPLSEKQVADWTIQICDALSYLHTKEQSPLLFKNIRPSNIMANETGRIILIDFGIARVFQRERRETLVGGGGYSPPEQYRGEESERGDVYALGATMHHLLTGIDPRGEIPFTFHQRPPRKINPSISIDMEKVIMKSLEYEPENRFPSILDMGRALREITHSGSGVLSATPNIVRPLQTGNRSAGVELIWTFETGDEVRSSPCIYGGAVFIGSYDNCVYSLDGQTGQVNWKFATEAGVCGTPFAEKDTIFIGSEDGNIYALHAQTGRQIWFYRTGGPVRSSPRVAYSTVYVGSDDQYLYALDARWGRVIWRTSTWKQVRSSPSVIDDLVFFGSEDEYFYSVNANTGDVRWKYHSNGGIVSSPSTSEGPVLFGSLDRNLYAIDPSGGYIVWRCTTEGYITSSPAVEGRRVFVGSTDKNLYCVDLRTGKVLWRFATGGHITSSPRVKDGRVYFGCADQYIYCLEAVTGAVSWRFKTNGAVPGSVAIGEGIVYVGSTDKKIYALTT